jgi:hypothetical protein
LLCRNILSPFFISVCYMHCDISIHSLNVIWSERESVLSQMYRSMIHVYVQFSCVYGKVSLHFLNC